MELAVVNNAEKVKAEEQYRVRHATEIERHWWQRAEKFLTDQEAQKAVQDRILTTAPRTDGNYRLIGRLGDENGEPDLVRPEALSLLQEIASEWRMQLGENHPNAQLAVTSLYRGGELQGSLKAGSGGYLAVGCEESSHSAGAAFDISLRSYYEQHGDKAQGVQAWNSDGAFDPSVLQSLSEILDGFRERGSANYVIENNISDQGEAIPSVLHVCVSPPLQQAQAA